MKLQDQNKILQKINDVMSKPIIQNKKHIEFFQVGILTTNNALIMLHDYMKKYEFDYILTRRLNQDLLEHFFRAMRSQDGLHDHPSPQYFMYRIRKYIQGK